MLVQFAHCFDLVRFLRLVYFLGSRISMFYGFWDPPRAPAPLCGHGLLRQRVNVRTTTTKLCFIEGFKV